MKNKKDLDLYAPIIPQIGLGGLVLSTHIKKYKELVESFSWLDTKTLEDKSVSLFSSFHIGYELQDVLIMIFDVLTGELQRICAKKGYQGLLLNRIKTGMLIEEAIKLEPRLKYDEDEEHFYIEGLQGVTVETDAYNNYIEIITLYTGTGYLLMGSVET